MSLVLSPCSNFQYDQIDQDAKLDHHTSSRKPQNPTTAHKGSRLDFFLEDQRVSIN